MKRNDDIEEAIDYGFTFLVIIILIIGICLINC
jgi:hypothetical protein